DHSTLQASKNHIPTAIGILSGIKPRKIPIKEIQKQVQIVRDRGFAGVSFFFYESLWNLAEEPVKERQAAFKTMFPTTAQRPNLTNGWIAKE
ncbi:MAG: hypothetical protein F6K24_47075, partial [Okeania sp. SIO2D1]|nr:hypothetical protein [Okeania sp. SIO2D1]